MSKQNVIQDEKKRELKIYTDIHRKKVQQLAIATGILCQAGLCI